MKLKIFQIDAFADRVFSGNPAAVCIMDAWLDASLMQQIAAENNLAETAFVVKENDQYHIRWFTPEIEVDLCGHATLASAFVLFNHYIPHSNTIAFYSHRSGPLTVDKGEDGYYVLDFPVDILDEVATVPALNKAMGIIPKETYRGKTDYLLICDNQSTIEEINPNLFLLDKIDARGVIVSAQGQEVDFVSRFFAPQSGITEDPVTGSAHTTLTPYWSKKLGKNVLYAKQLSQRGGALICEDRGERIKISGKAVAYLQGEIEI